MAKKRFNLLRTILLSLFIVLLIVPLVLSAIEIVVEKDKVKITAIYEGYFTGEGGNLTSYDGDWLLYKYGWNMSIDVDKYDPPSKLNTTFTFGDTGDVCPYTPIKNPRPCFVLKPGDYTFSFTGENNFGRRSDESEDFSVDLTPCNDDNIVVPPEECDGDNLSGVTCETYRDPITGEQPYTSGDLDCYDCAFDPSGCLMCSNEVCSICDNVVCANNGNEWVEANYVDICGEYDSDLGDLASPCSPGSCDVEENKYCNSNRMWTSEDYCNACADEDYSCSASSCDTGSCDVVANAFCRDSAWLIPTDAQYCVVCGDIDSECNDCDNNNEGDCDIEKNLYCDDSAWISFDYCDECSDIDSDCGIPVCMDGACDICDGAKKYCNNGVWETDNYCDPSRCGWVDSSCGLDDCVDDTCDTVAHQWCDFGRWESDWQLYCDNCQDEDSSGYCVNPEDCGNGEIDQWGLVAEACDIEGPNLNGATCLTWPQFIGGDLGCASNCLDFDRTNCIPREDSCGYPGINGDDQCDGDELGGRECTDPIWNFAGGDLACNDDCTYDTSGCIPAPECGDHVKNQDSEDCDDPDLDSRTCESFGFDFGDLECTSGCEFDKSDCGNDPGPDPKVCNDGIVQKPNDAGFDEQCDGTNLDNKDCQDVGYDGGDLACAGDCSFDYTDCYDNEPTRCGDGSVQQPNDDGQDEDCDRYDLNTWTCEALGYDGGDLDCTSSCEFDKSDCVTEEKFCGDNSVQKPNDNSFYEQCDGTDRDDKQCTDFDTYTGGLLDCLSDCTFDESDCDGGTFICGDGVKNQDTEDCDNQDLNGWSCKAMGYDSGTLACFDNCKFDKTGCSRQERFCGDSAIQTPNDAGFNEQCDDGDWNDNQCPDFDAYTGGYLDCLSDCTFDESDCTGGTFICGDGVKNQDTEDCDGSDLNGWTCIGFGYDSGTLDCTSSCKFDKSDCEDNYPTNRVCGDGLVQHPNDADFDEQCDGTNTESNDCQDVGYDGGTLGCAGDCTFDYSGCTTTSPTVCGDGAVQQPNDDGFVEACDDNDLNGWTCKALGYDGGTLGCTDTCELDKSNCQSDTNYCGDSIAQKPNDAGFNEDCDNEDLNGKDCQGVGYDSGILGCAGDCTFDYSNCISDQPTTCGDGSVQQPNDDGEIESCDRQDLNGWTCEALGYDRGTLACTSSCEFDRSNCESDSSFCGDGSVQQPNDAGLNEACDGTDLDGAECEDKDDYTNGTLACSGDCTYDYTGCGGGDSVCGNGELEPGEHCDPDVIDDECTSIGDGNFIGGTLSCDDDCLFDISDCEVNETPAVCGDGIVNGWEGCDGDNLAGLSCSRFRAYGSGVLKCQDNCTLDFTYCIKGNGTPVPAHCNNNVTDEDETDLNCGGTVCLGCENGKRCLLDSDCLSNYCDSNICKEASCTDGKQNGFETGVDCGGDCEGCPVGEGCRPGFLDCLLGLFCHPITETCVIPTCDDGYQNGDETDVDCGGGCPVKCDNGKKCISPNDCKSAYCDLGICGVDKNLDSDGDGMPDWWEEKHFLDPFDPSDADEDPDKDGRSNLDEYYDDTDPNVPDGDMKKNRTLQIILLIIGLLLMLGSAGFLIYSRKVLIPQQRATQRQAAAQRQAAIQRQQAARGARPAAAARRPGVRRPSREKSARKSLISKFRDKEEAGAKKQAGAPTTTRRAAPRPGAKPTTEEFVPLSELGKKKAPEKKKPEAKKKPSSAAFAKLKQLSKESKESKPLQKGSESSLKELSDSYKKKAQKKQPKK